MGRRTTPGRRASLIVGACLLAGCGSGTDVPLAKVPPTTSAPAAPEKKSKNRIPKNAQFSPATLPGQAN